MSSPGEPDGEPDVRERLLRGAAALMATGSVDDLTVRRVAHAAGRSTMCVYTKFGGRQGLLEAFYVRSAGELLATLRGAGTVSELAGRYREFAGARPTTYELLFGRSLAAVELDLVLRQQVLGQVTDLIAEALGREHGTAGTAARDTAYAVWCVLHGLVSLELASGDRDRPWGPHFERCVDALLGRLPA